MGAVRGDIEEGRRGTGAWWAIGVEPVTRHALRRCGGAGPAVPLASVRLLAPVEVRRVFGVGLNYVNHIKETGSKTPRIPLLFMKPESAIVGPDAPVIYPREGQEVHYEAELAVVIGRRVRRDRAGRRAVGGAGLHLRQRHFGARDPARGDGAWARWWSARATTRSVRSAR